MNNFMAEQQKLRELSAKALAQAEERDRKHWLAILQMSPRRYAIICEGSSLSWSHIGSDETDPASYLTCFSVDFYYDGDGKPLNNLTWREAQDKYKELMLEANKDVKL